MLKFLAVIVLIYLFFKALGAIFRTMLGGSGNRQGTFGRQNAGRQSTQQKGNINVDHNPNRSKGYKGGEYVDYEEVE